MEGLSLFCQPGKRFEGAEVHSAADDFSISGSSGSRLESGGWTRTSRASWAIALRFNVR